MISIRHIEIKDKTQCCGCGACMQKCPKDAISLEYDEEGFKYPVVNGNCIECGQCVKVCHLLHPLQFSRKVPAQTVCYCGFNKDGKTLEKSSSGGIFWPLASLLIQEGGGVVYGAELTDNFRIVHKRSDSLVSCTPFMKSKYLQSDTLFTYREVKDDLAKGVKVLYSGTPCQIAGLYSYLGGDNENLYTCEVVCHGVPSRVAFDKWLKELEKEHDSKPVSMVWRDKTNGWRPNVITYKFEDGTAWSTTSQKNLFQKGFLDNLYLRPSCYKCHYAKIPRIADISLADFWGYDGRLKELNSNKGLSIVIISSEKGSRMFNRIKGDLVHEKVDVKKVMECSRHVYIHPETNIFRPLFFKTLSHNTFNYSASKYLYPGFWMRVYRKIKKLIGND